MGGYFRKSWICKKTSWENWNNCLWSKFNKLWALVESNEGGVYVSENAGKSWKKINEDRKLRQELFIIVGFMPIQKMKTLFMH